VEKRVCAKKKTEREKKVIPSGSWEHRCTKTKPDRWKQAIRQEDEEPGVKAKESTFA